ncbi:MAG TPA: methyltransferase domain-containing protein [Planctomycetota bacterium]|jgi:ubiquinone/menaquinone biosynthesis C-methylase UbiE
MPDVAAPEDFADWNEQMIQRYDPAVFAHHPSGAVRWVENKRTRTVLRKLAAQRGDKILDVGCGCGHILAQVECAERHALDLSKFMIGLARERLGAKATVVQGDAEKLPFADASFDRVIASSLLAHVLHPDAVVDELRRVVKPGGRVIISVCLEENVERGLQWTRTLRLNKLFFGKSDKPQAYSVDYHLHHFTLPRLRETVGSKLKELSLTHVPFVFPVHAIALYERIQD